MNTQTSNENLNVSTDVIGIRSTVKDGAPATIARTAAYISFAAAATGLVSLAALHFLSPEFDSSWRFVSEYALGSYGWVLSLMFLSLAVSCVSLFFAIRPYVRTIAGKIGLAFLLLVATGLGMAVFFDVNHALHGLAAMIGIPSSPIAAVLISVSLARSQVWSSWRRLLLWTANLNSISLALMTAAIFIGLSQTGGEFGPGVLAGWPNRLYVVTLGGWLMAAAWQAARITGE
jgi:hypothetical protein